jgi:hypothetical protein
MVAQRRDVGSDDGLADHVKLARGRDAYADGKPVRATCASSRGRTFVQAAQLKLGSKQEREATRGQWLRARGRMAAALPSRRTTARPTRKTHPPTKPRTEDEQARHMDLAQPLARRGRGR